MAGSLTPSSAKDFSSWFGAIIRTTKAGGVSISITPKGKSPIVVNQGQFLAQFMNGSVEAFDASQFLSQFELVRQDEFDPGRRARKPPEDDSSE